MATWTGALPLPTGSLAFGLAFGLAFAFSPAARAFLPAARALAFKFEEPAAESTAFSGDERSQEASEED